MRIPLRPATGGTPSSARISATTLATILTIGSLLLVGGAAASVTGAAAGTTHSPASPIAAAPLGPNVRTTGPLPASATPQATATLTSTGISPTVLGLSWTAAAALGFGNYTVERSPNGSTGPWTSVTVLTSSTSTTFTDTQLAPGSVAWWQVVSTGLFPETTNALEVTQASLALLNFTTPTSSSVQFNWTNDETYGAALTYVSYSLFESIDGGTPSSVTTIAAIGTETYTVQGLSPASSYAFFLDTTDCLSGCSTGAPVDSITSSNVVTFGTPLPLTATVTPVRSTIDVGQADLLTCSPSGGVSPFQFAWDSGNGTFVPGGSAVSLSYPDSGPETVTCQVTDTASTQVTATTVLTVNPLPVLTLETNRTAVDVGQPVAFTCTSVNGTAPVTLSWAFGDGAQTSGGLTSHTYATPGAFLAACSGVDGTGTVVQASTAVVASPDPDVSATASASTAAPGTSLSFHATATNGSGAFTNYTWTFGDGALGYGAALTHAFSAPSTYSVHVTVVDSNGGSATATTSVKVSNLLAGATVDSTAASVGSAIDFRAAPSGGAGGPYNVTWTFGDGTTGYGVNVSHDYSAGGTFQPSVTVTDALGAQNTTALPAITVTVPPIPGPWFTSLDAVLLLAFLVLLAIVAVLALRRRRIEAKLATVQGRIPPTDPNEVTKGARVCRNCGTSNLPLRETCVNCGRSLRRSPF